MTKEMGRLTLPDTVSYYVAALIKALRCWQKDRCIDQWSRRENPEIDPHSYAPLISDKSAKAIHWRKNYLFNKWDRSNYPPRGKRKGKKLA